MDPAALALLTDFYELTMLGGYFETGRTGQRAVFDLYFRRIPHNGGFCLAAGLQPALEYLQALRFSADDIAYLRGLGRFSQGFLDWLRDFRFRGEVWAVPEGRLVFPSEPLLRVSGTIPECQLVESALLNIINFQTLIATKAARICTAAGPEATVVEFGLRRAQGIDGAMSATRAAYIGGCQSTSNTLAGKVFGLPVTGTMAHSWVMSFPDELSAFRAYADIYPDSCLLLVDTYDTLGSGVPNAVRVGLELKERGHRLLGIRLDSGDLAHLSKEARRMLDEAGLEFARIVASNELDEWLIRSLRQQGARIDIYGVGTRLVTSAGEPALGGVYKLVAAEEDGRTVPRIKVSSNPEKTTLPGVKQVWRAWRGGKILGDVICLADEELQPRSAVRSCHPLYAHHSRTLWAEKWEPLLVPVMKDGRVTCELPPLE
ncbi:MAG TPA: nicotinate phosphoribosyltransferase, partial [Candidatus Nitrosotenuis sp.]|nr:nicotinate phosphoribosyltransferase [Candidatus Nitrosotenuis sp.]